MNHAGMTAGLLIGLLAVPASAVVRSTSVVALSGEAVGDGTETVWTTLGTPALNDAGQVAFFGRNSNEESGVFRGDALQSFRLLARDGEGAPDGDGVFERFILNPGGAPLLNNQGQTAFTGRLSGTSSGSRSDEGIFLADGLSPIRSIVREGQPAPDGDETFSQFGRPKMNDAGQVAYYGRITGTTNLGFRDEGIFRGDGAETPTQIARAGQVTPAGDAQFGLFDEVVSINDTGHVAFTASLENASEGSTRIFRGDGAGSLQEIVRTGEPVIDGNGVFSSFESPPLLNEAGEVTFVARLALTTDRDSVGVFSGDGSVPAEPLVRSGQLAPGGQSTFSSFFDLDQNNAGHVSFHAILQDNSRGIYRYGDDEPAVEIVRSGQPVPDGDGVFSTIFASHAMSGAGQVVFVSLLSQTDGGDDDDAGVFFYDDRYGLVTVAREGDALLGSKIEHLAVATAFGAVSNASINVSGQVAYNFLLADGRQGIAITTVRVPEPAAWLLATMTFPLVARRMR